MNAYFSIGNPFDWFWGEFGNYRRPLFEVAAGSFVANLLAVAVAMFSLQVYDRVIPGRSIGTLVGLSAMALAAFACQNASSLVRSSVVAEPGSIVKRTGDTEMLDQLLPPAGSL